MSPLRAARRLADTYSIEVNTFFPPSRKDPLSYEVWGREVFNSCQLDSFEPSKRDVGFYSLCYKSVRYAN
jgi:hypothetical protein